MQGPLITDARGSFASPKVQLIFEDGVEFVKRLAVGSFDVIIMDSIDFGGVLELTWPKRRH